MDHCVIGIDVGGTQMKAGLFNVRGELLRRETLETQQSLDEQEFFARATALASSLRAASAGIAAVGIGLAGVLNRQRTTLIQSPNLPRLHDVPVAQVLAAALGLPVLLDNDANCAALGELWQGAGQGLKNFLLVTLGTGVGAGLVLDGSLWRGDEGKAGEFGHMVVNAAGVQCGCGKQGCLETRCSGSAIVRMAREALEAGRPSSLADMISSGPDDLTPEAVYHAARQGDQLSREIYRAAADYLAIGLANVNNLLDIHTFIVGGGVGRALDLIEPDLLAGIRSRVYPLSRSKIRILPSVLGNDAGIYGAGYLAISPG